MIIEKRNPRIVAVVGGSFDPPHIQHLVESSMILAASAASEVWMVPCGDRSDKKNHATPNQRLRMTRTAVEETFPRGFPIIVEPVEVINGAALPTVILMRTLRTLTPEVDSFFVVIGSDLLEQIPLWKGKEDLLKENDFLILARGDSTSEKSHMPDGMRGIWLNDVMQQNLGMTNATSSLSSTFVRTLIERTRSPEAAAGLVPQGVISQIKEMQLYLNAQIPEDF